MSSMLMLLLITLVPFALTTPPPSPTPSPSPPTSTGGFSAELIPVSDPRSPFYDNNPSSANQILVLNVDDTSIEISSVTTRTILSSHSIMIINVGREFTYPHYHPIRVVADTGSSLVWIQCKPCKNCFKQKVPVYDPRSQVYYKPPSCRDAVCRLEGVDTYCGDSNECAFSVNYGDGSYANGVILREWLSIPTSQYGVDRFELGFVEMGCGNDNRFSYPGDGAEGIVGLDTSSTSFIRQLHYTAFSYCISAEGTNWIRFGSDAKIVGDIHIPLLANKFYKYHIRVVKITVGGVELDIKSYFEMIPSSQYETGMIIDSGTTLTHLPEQVMSQLVDQFKKRMYIEDITREGVQLHCTYLTTYTAWLTPGIVFEFEGGATLIMTITNTWVHIGPILKGPDRSVCLAFLRSKDDLHILGRHTLLSMNVAYDLAKGEIVIHDTSITTGCVN